MKLDKKESTRARPRDEVGAATTREERKPGYVPLSGGTSAALHCATHAALIRVIRSARRNFEPLVKEGASEMPRDIARENEREKEKRRERARKTRVVPRAASCRSYIVISFYLPNDKSARSLSTRYPLGFMRELIVDLTKKKKISAIYRLRDYPA